MGSRGLLGYWQPYDSTAASYRCWPRVRVTIFSRDAHTENTGGRAAWMNWEYKVEMIHIYSAASDAIVKRLNELGSDGWEVVSTIDKAGDTAGVLLKRQKAKQ
jgi:hypothetical protein